MGGLCSLSVVRRWVPTVALGLVVAGVISPSVGRASAATCQDVPAANVGSGANEFRGVSVVSSRNVWAVGDYYSPGAGAQPRALIEHWNGRAWSVQTSPRLANSKLLGVAATSPRNAWAVGYDKHGAVIEHWNGRTWKVQPSPNLGSNNNRAYGVTVELVGLTGVTATSSRNAWAVGYDRHSAVIEHWDGRAWKLQARKPGPGNGPYNVAVGLLGVSATSSRNAWAVGVTARPKGRSPSETQALIEHWNGRAWKAQPSPFPRGLDFVRLSGVAATSSTNAWAVGMMGTIHTGGEDGEGLIEHWNGRVWKVQAAVSVGGYASGLSGVAAASSRNAWAVGEPFGMIDHWNGSAWRASASPADSGISYRLLGVAAKSSTGTWAVGSYNNVTSRQTQPLALRCS